ncbi:MAG: hypothetical protein AB1599_10895, partial [Planctomycetota bacterium]
MGDSNAIGTVTMSGANTELNITGSLMIGYILNGNTNTYTSADFTVDGGHLTVKSSAANQGLYIGSMNLGTNCVVEGVMNMNGGVIDANFTHTGFVINLGRGGGNNVGGSASGTLNMDGGTINMNGPAASTFYVGYGVYGSELADGLLNMTGGVINMKTGGMWVNDRFASTNANNRGRIQMTGGTINLNGNLTLGRIKSGYPDAVGDVNFFGGEINCTRLTVNSGTFEIQGYARLVSTGDRRTAYNNYVNNGKIIETDPKGELVIEYDGTADKTYVYLDRYDDAQAWDPYPGVDSVVFRPEVVKISWKAGDGVKAANGHELYFGTDEAAVADADVSDTTGIYIGALTDVNWTVTPVAEMGEDYYWRVDEVDTLGVRHRGRMWHFSVQNYQTVDDFEDYNDTAAMLTKWTADGGATLTLINKVTDINYQNYVDGGVQGMKFEYAGDSTATMSVSDDWARDGIAVLRIRFRPQAENVMSNKFYVTINDSSAGSATVELDPNNMLMPVL